MVSSEGNCIIAASIIILSFLPPPTNGAGFGGSGGRSLTERNWCYDKEDCKEGSATSEWEMSSCKNGERQSPIDISKPDVYPGDCPLDFGVTKDPGYVLSSYNVANYGKILQVELTGDTEATFRYPHLNDGTYKLQTIRFHWGSDDATGSEHTIGGKRSAAEMHLFHYRSGGPDSYKSLEKAVVSGDPDALAIIGFMLEVDAGTKESFLHPLTKDGGEFDKVPNVDDKKPGTATWDLTSVLKSQKKAYTYKGSHTQPYCNENVQWFICDQPVKISKDDIDKFKLITKQQTTIRKVQPLNGRYINHVEIIH